TDADTKTPISDVGVVVVGTNRAARTNAAGQYRITNVPAGAQQVHVARLGYGALTQAVTVRESANAEADFTLRTASTTLAQVVITGTSTQTQQARENGASIGVIPLDSINATPVTDFTELLDARVPGLAVQQISGSIGTASKIVIRGAGTAALSDQPLIVVDGIRAYNDINGFFDLGGVGGQSISRFDDLDKESIEDVQVLKGAAAAALYGTEAAAGVIVIQTRHGDVGQSPRWHLFGNLGSIRNYVDYPANWGRGPSSNPSASCSLIFEYAGACTGANGALGATKAYNFNLVENSPTLHNGYNEGTGLSVGGGSPAITYYLGANWTREQGIFLDNADRWTHLSGAFTIHPYSIFDLSTSIQYTQRRTLLPIGDNGIGGVLTADLLGGPGKNLYFAGLTANEAEQAPNNENVDRYTFGTSGTLRATPWLTFKGTAGLDYLTQYDSYFYSQVVLPPVVTATGNAGSANNSIFTYTGSASAIAQYRLASSLTGSTTFGGEWQDYSLRQTTGTGQGLVPGTNDLSGATGSFTTFEINNDIVNIGGFVQQQFTWRNVLYATVAARLDGNSAFGNQQSTALYPSGNLSYVISDERFWPRNAIVSSLRLRAAAGQTGVQPFFRQALGSFTSGGYNTFGQGTQIALLPNTYASANLKPERSTEYEGGFDIGIGKERATLTVTAYDKTERNLVQQENIDISTGVGPGLPPSFLYSNLGSIDNRGLEFGLSANLFRSTPVTFDIQSNFYLERNKLVNLGKPAANQITPSISGNRLQLDTTGFPLGEYFAVPYTYADKNHDGIIEPNELTFGTHEVAVGEPGPREELTIAPTLTLFRYIRVNTLFDRRDGITVYDGTDAFRCFGSFEQGRECNDPHAPLKDQAAAVAQNGGFFGQTGSDYGYLLNGSFWKWRELSVALTAPESWSRRYLGGHSATITISGRNLGTWSPYRGLDPELSQYGGAFNPAASAQFFSQPPVRYWIGRVDLTW
ncbi:MAG TPA: TonB-dependent receptor, partial [Gemmatimonadaceae bacterium]|nr:TonB-dependent receptor [Gemmatimonadaceae bacterium]